MQSTPIKRSKKNIMKIYLDPFKVDGRVFEYTKTINAMGRSYYLHIPFLTIYWRFIKK